MATVESCRREGTRCTGESALFVPSSAVSASDDDADSLAAELDTEFSPLSDDALDRRDYALHVDLILDAIFSFLRPIQVSSCARVCRAWKLIAERRARQSARLLLAPLIGLEAARSVEEEIYAMEGSGPGEANTLLRRVAANFSRNRDLATRVTSGELSPRALLGMTPLEMATPRDRAYVAEVRKAAIAAACAARAPSHLVVAEKGRHVPRYLRDA